MPSFLYDRVISIWRDGSADAAQPAGGLQGYGGRVPGVTDVLVVEGLDASIQPKGRQRSNNAELPGEAAKSQWEILVPPGGAAPAANVLLRGMIAKDDTGREFLIFAADPTPLGWRFLCDQLEV